MGVAGLAGFRQRCGSITQAESKDLWERGWDALLAAAEAANAAVGETDPARRFLALLGSAIASGRAHVASRTGAVPLPNLGPGVGGTATVWRLTWASASGGPRGSSAREASECSWALVYLGPPRPSAVGWKPGNAGTCGGWGLMLKF